MKLFRGLMASCLFVVLGIIGNLLGQFAYVACSTKQVAAATPTVTSTICVPSIGAISLAKNGNSLNHTMSLSCGAGNEDECYFHYVVSIYDAGGNKVATNTCQGVGPQECGDTKNYGGSFGIPAGLPAGNYSATLGVWTGYCPLIPPDAKLAPKKTSINFTL